MAYRKSYKPKNYREIAPIIDQTLALEVNHRFHVKMQEKRKLRTTFLLREFLHLQHMTEDYVINEDSEGLWISRYGKVEYEITIPEPIAMGETGEIRSGSDEEHEM
uniref:Uncharacterized protein n=1 Tax=viral metagenome TaxID=1070528 RepID=A0A6M3LIB8_9ZZZZ